MRQGDGGAARSRFQIGPLLGAGTFGEVYLARMTSTHGIEQDVAVKLLNPGLDPRSQPVTRMRDEGRILASLNHPAILSVMDFCLLEGRIGLVTEYVRGADLFDCIQSPDPLPPRAALQVIGAVAEALAVAHHTSTQGGGVMALVHRDIKPANIRLTPHATVKVLDFGIAKSEDAGRETATTERMAIGTPSYMSPEVHTYEVVDALPSRDIFALGCTLFEALSGELYFEGLDPKGIVRVCNRPERFAEWRSVRMPRVARHGPAAVELLSRMLRYDHQERPDAQEVADTCHALAESSEGDTLRTWCKRHPWPEPHLQAGPWSGREMWDEGVATQAGVRPGPARRPDPGATLAPLLDDDGPNTRAPRAGPTIVEPPTAASTGSPAPQAALPTQVVVVPTQIVRSGRRRKRIGILDLAGFTFALMLVVTAFSAWRNPALWPHLLRGEFGAILPSLADLAPAMPRGDAPVAVGLSHAWGASAATDPLDLVSVRLDGDVAVSVSREGEQDFTLQPGSEVMLPPGEVHVSARFSMMSGWEPQIDTTLGAGEVLRISCTASDALCIRR